MIKNTVCLEFLIFLSKLVTMKKLVVLITTIFFFFIILHKYLFSTNILSQTYEHSVIDSGFHIKSNIFDIEYILNSEPCQDAHKIILIITCYAGHIELRSAHRRALPSQLLHTIGIKRVFLLAELPKNNKDDISQESLKNENELFGDLVQGNFVEAYRNLTLKHIMGLKWASSHCSSSEFIIKLDDDIVFNIYGILKLLNNYKMVNKSNFLLGYLFKAMKPIRNQVNKWFVSNLEYKKSFYPPFLSGWMYVTTAHTAAKLVSQAMVTPYFWIDDVYVTGILASYLGIHPQDLSSEKVYLIDPISLNCCMEEMEVKNITCEYYVGPNGGDNEKIFKFTKSLEYCAEKKCLYRPPGKLLKDTCKTTFNGENILNKGQPVIKVFKL